MGEFLGFLVLIFIIVALCWRWISPWLARSAQHRMEDFIRRQMGMPSRKEEEKARRRAEKENRASADARRRASTNAGRAYGRRTSSGEPLIPKEYAVDVEYVEIKEYSQTEIAPDGTASAKSTRKRFSSRWKSVKEESQVEDADFTEISQ